MTHVFHFGCLSVTATTLALLTSACAPTVTSAPTVSVVPSAETTAVATTNADAADDPAIWAAPPGQSVNLSGMRVRGFITGTDKKAGLYVFGLDGRKQIGRAHV